MQRRQFILAGSGLIGYLGAGSGAALAATAARSMISRAPEALSAATFSAALNAQVNVYGGVRGVTMQLSSVVEAKPQPGLQQFAVYFTGRAADQLPSGSYEVEHASFGKIALYLQASADPAKAGNYRADFCLLA